MRFTKSKALLKETVSQDFWLQVFFLHGAASPVPRERYSRRFLAHLHWAFWRKVKLSSVGNIAKSRLHGVTYAGEFSDYVLCDSPLYYKQGSQFETNEGLPILKKQNDGIFYYQLAWYSCFKRFPNLTDSIWSSLQCCLQCRVDYKFE